MLSTNLSDNYNHITAVLTSHYSPYISHMKITWRIQFLFWWYTFFRRKFNRKRVIKIGKKGRGASKIIFLLPAEKEHAQIASHFVKRDFVDDNLKVRYVVHQEGIQYYSDQLKPDIISFSNDDMNWVGAIVSKSVLDRIKSIRYDAMVDLNQSDEQTLSLLSMELDIPVKIGFQSPLSDKLYTLVIQRSTTGFLETNYETIERILGLK
ncbi:MAG: hypothetical protein VX586_01085 [Candidatus Neomarinimicrobiota bacterium]|nr:hypothetical protein [Candidatus Neomarinimicrobiota bacterium]